MTPRPPLAPPLAPPLSLDNFEAISATRGPDGGLRLYILSDDNFSALQRTLIMQFTLPESKPVVAGPQG